MGIRAICLAGVLALAAASEAAVSVPQISGVQIDGSSADWAGRGTQVRMLLPVGTPRFSTSTFDAGLLLGWDTEGLLLWAHVKDVVHTEADLASELWRADCLELFLADKVGGLERVQILVAPGMDDKYPEPRQSAVDNRSEKLKSVAPEAQIARVKTADGYDVEIRVPWSILGRKAAAGDVLGFQLYAESKDAEQPQTKLMFYPQDGTHQASTRMHELVLKDDAASRVDLAVSAEYRRLGQVKAELLAPPAYAGRSATVSLEQPEGGALQQKVVSFSLAGEGRAVAKAIFPAQMTGEARVVASMEGVEPAFARLPDISVIKAEAFLREPLYFTEAVFSGTQFPQIDFQNPQAAELMIGDYEIACTFYDRDYNVVTTAERPGRYGAVVQITTEDGRTLRRFRTLFRTEKELQWWDPFPIRVEWPAEVGLDPAVVREQYQICDEYLGSTMFQTARTHGQLAELFAGLHETKQGASAGKIMLDPYAMDRAWWLKLKRKLYGADTRFTTPLQRPRVVAGALAPVLREGSEAEAGFAAGTREKLDALLKEWASESGEAFTVCVARNGVILLEGGYGTRDGKPMAPETMSIVFSISKAISGTAVMMAVDQGLLSLEDTPAKYLPPFASAKGKQPTIAQLFTHTAGMQGHWGDEDNDFEEVMAEHLKHLKIGEQHAYNGASLALGCKVLEQLTGETLPEYYSKHIFTPLGMSHTQSTSCSWRTWSTAGDLAKLGQMLLNGGAYGDQVFFSKETHASMLPHKLTRELGSDSEVVWGIGLTYMDPEKTIIGHGSASNSTFYIIPSMNLVVTMARNDAGKDFEKFQKQFMELIKSSVVP